MSHPGDGFDPRLHRIPVIIYDDVASPDRPLHCVINLLLNDLNPTDVLDFHSSLFEFVFTFPQYEAQATQAPRLNDRMYLTRLSSRECGIGPDLSNAYEFEPIRAWEGVTCEDLLGSAVLDKPLSLVWLYSNFVPDPALKRPFSPSPTVPELHLARGAKRSHPPSPGSDQPSAQKRRIFDTFPRITLLNHQPTKKLRGTDIGMRVFVVGRAFTKVNISTAVLTGEAVRDISQLPARAILLDRSMFAQVVYDIAGEVEEKIFLLHHCDYNLLFFLCSILEIVHGQHLALESRTYLGQMLIDKHSAARHKFDIWRIDLSTLLSAVVSPQSFGDALMACLLSSFSRFIHQSYYLLWAEVDKMAKDGYTFADIMKETLTRISDVRSPESSQVMILVVGYTMAADMAWFMSVAGRTDSIHPSIVASALAISLFAPLCAWVNSDLVASVYCFGTHGGLADEMHPYSTLLRSGALDLSHDERVKPFTSVDTAELKCVMLTVYTDLSSSSTVEHDQRTRPRINEIVAYAGGYNSAVESAEGIRWSWFFEIIALLLGKSPTKKLYKSHDTLSVKHHGVYSRTFCNPEYLPQFLSTIGTLMAQMPKEQVAALSLIASNMPYPIPPGTFLDDHLRYDNVKPIPTGSTPSQKVDMYPSSLDNLLKLLIAIGLLVVIPQSETATHASDSGVAAASSLSTSAALREVATTSANTDTVMANANAAPFTLQTPNTRALAFLRQICTQHRGMLKVDAAIEGPDQFGQWVADGIEAHLKDQVTRTIENISENTFQQMLLLLVKLAGNSSTVSIIEELELTDPSSKWRDPQKTTDLIYADIFIPEYRYLAELKVATLQAIKNGVMGPKRNINGYSDRIALQMLDEALQSMDMTPTPSRAEAHIWSDKNSKPTDFKTPDQFKDLKWEDLRIRVHNQSQTYMTLDELWHDTHQQVKDYWEVVNIGNIPENPALNRRCVTDRRVASIRLSGTERLSGYRAVMLLVGGRRVVHDVEKVDGMKVDYINSLVTGSHNP